VQAGGKRFTESPPFVTLIRMLWHFTLFNIPGLWILAKEYRAPKILLQWIGEMTDRQIGFVCKLLKKCLNSLEPALLKLSKVTDQKLSSIRKTCSTLKERFRKKSRVPSPRIGQTVELESLIWFSYLAKKPCCNPVSSIMFTTIGFNLNPLRSSIL
jgi:hypothetical protein